MSLQGQSPVRIDRFSWSKFSTAALCGQIYFYRYVEKLRTTAGASMVRGLGPHKAAEANYTAQIKTGEPLALEHVREISATACKRSIRADGLRVDGGYEGVPLRRLAGLLVDESVALATEYRTKIAPKITPIATELKIEIPPSAAWPFTHVGVIDVVDDQAIIHDTKTKRKAPTAGDADASGQLTNYELLFRAYFGRPSAGQAFDYVWQTPARRELKSVTQTTQRATHQLARFALEVKATHAQLEAEIYVPAKASDWICSPKWCEFTGICPVYNAGRERVTS